MRRVDMVLRRLGFQVDAGGKSFKTFTAWEPGRQAKTGRPAKYFDSDDAEVETNELRLQTNVVCVDCDASYEAKCQPRRRSSRKVERRRQDKEAFVCPCGDCISWGERRMHARSEVLDMKQQLIVRGIDLTTWGKDGNKSVWDLVWEQQHGHIQLKMDEERGKYTRYTRQLCIKLCARTLNKGDCVLMEVAETTGCEGTLASEDKFITKRMALGANWSEECTRVLQADLGLEPEWQKRNLQLVDHRNYEESQPAWKYPGLFSCYQIDEVHFLVSDPQSVDVLGLPHGFDFATMTFSKQHGTEKEQHWQWKVDPFTARILQRQSLVAMQEIRRRSSGLKRTSEVYNVHGRRSSVQAMLEKKEKARATLQGDEIEDPSGTRRVTFTTVGTEPMKRSSQRQRIQKENSVVLPSSADDPARRSPKRSSAGSGRSAPPPKRSVGFSNDEDESPKSPRAPAPQLSHQTGEKKKSVLASSRKSTDASKFHGVGPSTS